MQQRKETNTENQRQVCKFRVEAKFDVGMWNFFITEMNGGMSPDLTKSFFVGDAAGRDGDHSQCDSQFAQRIGLAFHLPETFFTE